MHFIASLSRRFVVTPRTGLEIHTMASRQNGKEIREGAHDTNTIF